MGGKQSGSGGVDPCYMREGYLCEQGEGQIWAMRQLMASVDRNI